MVVKVKKVTGGGRGGDVGSEGDAEVGTAWGSAWEVKACEMK